VVYRLADLQIEQGVMACGTCHDPHLDTRQWPAQLRRSLDQPPEAICSTCHLETAEALPHSMHAADASAAGHGDALARERALLLGVDQPEIARERLLRAEAAGAQKLIRPESVRSSQMSGRDERVTRSAAPTSQ